jgi:hypothetical protein
MKYISFSNQDIFRQLWPSWDGIGKLKETPLLNCYLLERGSFFNYLYKVLYNAGFGVLTLEVIKSSIFWDITPCSLLKVHRPFLLPTSPLFLAWLILRRWIWRRQVATKRQFFFNGLYGVISIDHQWSQCKGQFCGPPLYIYLSIYGVISYTHGIYMFCCIIEEICKVYTII